MWGETADFTHGGLTWHGEVLEGHGTEFGGERTHPVGIDAADPRRSGLHGTTRLTKALPHPLPETDPHALCAGLNHPGSFYHSRVNCFIQHRAEVETPSEGHQSLNRQTGYPVTRPEAGCDNPLREFHSLSPGLLLLLGWTCLMRPPAGHAHPAVRGGAGSGSVNEGFQDNSTSVVLQTDGGDAVQCLTPFSGSLANKPMAPPAGAAGEPLRVAAGAKIFC